jgi:hypothetical protein
MEDGVKEVNRELKKKREEFGLDRETVGMRTDKEVGSR